MSGIKDLFKGGVKEGVQGMVEGVAGVVDRFVETPEEKAALKAELEKEISKRWEADAQGSWLSQNIRPLTLASMLVVFFALMFTDGNIGGFVVDKTYIPIFNNLLLTAVSGYFVLRTIDKRGRVQ